MSKRKRRSATAGRASVGPKRAVFAASEKSSTGEAKASSESSSAPDAASVEQAKRLIRDVERALKKKSKKLSQADIELVQSAIDATRAAVDSGQRKRLRVAVKELDKVADTVTGPPRSIAREYAESITIAVMVALFIRFFAFEAFKIPSGSMIPTLEIGDHIFVNKFIYGVRVPLSTSSWIARWGSPQRGHVIVFRYPPEPSKDYIKRVVAVAGDKVRVDGDDVFVNDEKLPHSKPESIEHFDEAFGSAMGYRGYVEKSSDQKQEYQVQYRKGGHPDLFPDGAEKHPGLRCYVGRGEPDYCQVEPEYVFVMGDNRDNSEDSRVWGAVPHRLVKGRAVFVWLAWGDDGIDWGRFGKAVR